MNHVRIITEAAAAAAAAVAVVFAVAEVAVAVAVAAEVIVTDVRNQVILHVIVLNLIHAVDKVVAVVAVHQINKVMMMMEIRCRMKNKKSLFLIQRFHFFLLLLFVYSYCRSFFLFIRISI